MDISVIVVTYNQEDTIARTLDSILGQEFDGEFEIVVGDDASTDNTELICRRYAEAYPGKINYIRRTQNLGVVRNYFDCIARAEGEFLADCAGDDFWVDNHKLQKQYDYLRNNSDVSLVATNWMCCNPDGSEPYCHPGVKQDKEVRRLERHKASADILHNREWIHLCSALYRRRNLLEYVNRAPEIFINAQYSCEDLQILLAMSESGAIAFLPDTTLYYSVGQESISHQRNYARRFEYSSRTLMQKHTLQKFFKIQGSPKDYYAAIANLYALAFRSGIEEMMRQADEITRTLGVKISAKTGLYRAIAHLRPLWNITRASINRLHP